MTLLQVKNLKKYFPLKEGLLKAVDDISFEIKAGETFGLVGESGCGKSTLGRSLLRLQEPTSGEILFEGKNILNFSREELKSWRKEAQFVFQDPYASLNPRMTAEDIIAEPFQIHGIEYDEGKIRDLLRQVNLSPAHRKRFPHEFSGGQRQRIGLARALALTPRFIICDEPISALDVSVQAQIVNLFKKLQMELGLTFLFISHDLRMIKYLSDHVAVMYLGNIVELAPVTELFKIPMHPYTEALLSAIPIPDPKIEKNRSRIVLKGEVPSPVHPPQGCVFCTRCPKVMDICHKVRPETKETAPGHRVACHLYP
jgi:peptide/nickel transport system ATP-binding protein/oligopeptide transport system ATP-binding protein